MLEKIDVRTSLKFKNKSGKKKKKRNIASLGISQEGRD